MKHRETQARSVFKSVTWRTIAFLNSWAVLSFAYINSSFYNALIMNITGMVLFYVYERVWNKVEFGKYTLKR